MIFIIFNCKEYLYYYIYNFYKYIKLNLELCTLQNNENNYDWINFIKINDIC